MVESGIFYSNIIDPILAPMRKRVAAEIRKGEKVIDIACGTGAQLFDISRIASYVTGVDLSESMIEYATKNFRNKNIANGYFLVGDATNLSMLKLNRFDVAVMTLSLHQFLPELHTPVLNEMKRIANRIIIVDYAVPLPINYAGIGSRIAEFLAGREHNRNFKKYYKLGGLEAILIANNFSIQKSVLFGKGAFQLLECSYT
jgi:ubiquinone/menaquinone biosynthesis C-methylase UbiE